VEEGEELPGFRGGGPQGGMAGGRADVEGTSVVRAVEQAAKDGDAVVQAGSYGCAEDLGGNAVRGEGTDQLETDVGGWRGGEGRRRWRS